MHAEVEIIDLAPNGEVSLLYEHTLDSNARVKLLRSLQAMKGRPTMTLALQSDTVRGPSFSAFAGDMGDSQASLGSNSSASTSRLPHVADIFSLSTSSSKKNKEGSLNSSEHLRNGSQEINENSYYYSFHPTHVRDHAAAQREDFEDNEDMESSYNGRRLTNETTSGDAISYGVQYQPLGHANSNDEENFRFVGSHDELLGKSHNDSISSHHVNQNRSKLLDVFSSAGSSSTPAFLPTVPSKKSRAKSTGPVFSSRISASELSSSAVPLSQDMTTEEHQEMGLRLEAKRLAQNYKVDANRIYVRCHFYFCSNGILCNDLHSCVCLCLCLCLGGVGAQ